MAVPDDVLIFKIFQEFEGKIGKSWPFFFGLAAVGKEDDGFVFWG